MIHVEGNCCSCGTGKFHVDERLKYSYKSGSDTTHLLDPMLTLDPKDQRELVFDLELTPEGYFPTSGGRVIVILNYHTSEGRSGQLPLVETMIARRHRSKIAHRLEIPLVLKSPRVFVFSIRIPKDEIKDEIRIRISNTFSIFDTEVTESSLTQELLYVVDERGIIYGNDNIDNLIIDFKALR